MRAADRNSVCDLASRGRSVEMGGAGWGCEEASGAVRLTPLVRLSSCSHLRNRQQEEQPSRDSKHMSCDVFEQLMLVAVALRVA